MQEGGGAVLEMGGGTQLELAKLHIEKQGVIDWVGGYDKAANILWLDELTFSGPDAKLFMKNWREYEDILLVRKSSFDFARLNNISFEGYKGPTKWREYDKDFIEITPFIPEPATYGAILGALGVAVVAWRRRRANEASRRPFHRRDGVVASLDAVEATAQ
ncbi:hypothetical protein AXK11_06765 [Cephaloticoccus primus]|uniref:Ice-binding protein C-terminal domain-containing protein n=2 Tax=Cephaloticoccus primus TaxID=1548207 RepID=A0A139SL80_9BACT|nr:hypothetical protein AXK11_06765 [Cephaloticoccus primus]